MPNSTFIIPLKIDSDIRLQNITTSLKYILKHTDSNIIITEADEVRKLFLEELNASRVKYVFKKSSSTEFHRTLIINEMLSDVKTDITINYDADIVLPTEAFKTAEHLILNQNCDVVYPYGFEQFDQRKILVTSDSYEVFKNTLNLSDLKPEHTIVGFCRFGHVQFFKTKSYVDGFMENENYKHWCPEDEERGIRYQRLGYKVVWFRSIIFHQEHPPSTLSAPINRNEIYDLHKMLMNFNKEDLIAYYSNQEYIKKYKKV
jgi:hypothetical protein